MGAAIALVLADRREAVFVWISVFIIFCTTATLCLVFVPKVNLHNTLISHQRNRLFAFFFSFWCINNGRSNYQWLEMRRNPQEAADKRIRATLRPMSKNRRDSSACELEQRLRDVKTNNCRFRKALLEKEAELQVICRHNKQIEIDWLKCTWMGFCRLWYVLSVKRKEKPVHGLPIWIRKRSHCSIGRPYQCRLCDGTCLAQPMQPIWHLLAVWHRHMIQNTLPQ